MSYDDNNQYQPNPDQAPTNSRENEKNSVEKNPDDWVTGNEPMTAPQRSYLNTLAREAGEEPIDNLTKAEASKRIDELQQKTGRGTNEKS